MKNRLVKPTLVLVCLALLALPLFAQRGKGGGVVEAVVVQPGVRLGIHRA